METKHKDINREKACLHETYIIPRTRQAPYKYRVLTWLRHSWEPQNPIARMGKKQTQDSKKGQKIKGQKTENTDQTPNDIQEKYAQITRSKKNETNTTRGCELLDSMVKKSCKKAPTKRSTEETGTGPKAKAKKSIPNTEGKQDSNKGAEEKETETTTNTGKLDFLPISNNTFGSCHHTVPPTHPQH